MKKLLIFLALAMMIAGCSNSNDEEVTEEVSTDDETEETSSEEETDAASEVDTTDEEVENNEEADDSQSETRVGTAGQATSGDVPDLKLQVQKADEEAGVTIENNEMYSQLNEIIKADPKAGIPNDFSVFPNDIVYNEDGSTSILFFGVNRLRAPIQSIYFELTLGNQNGDYIFEGMPVTLDEEYMGIIEKDSAVPFLLDVDPEDEGIFMELTEENIDLRLDNYDLELDE
ncbi:hypothetical protein [Gracilibacillus saliphilus]|uniref:hypothetical protein n=1 Tax=Gracilibacillus saliphilus TaxID=543890 RepID=UPI0013D094A2|nr:hypothetical protein [Gracilibacillus saliphilus]